MTRSVRILLLTAFTGMGANVSAAEITCPPGADQVDVRVTPVVDYDAKGGTYTYRYMVQSLASSRLPIGDVTMEIPNEQVESMQSPDGWWGRPVQGKARAVWSAMRVANPDQPYDGGGVPRSIVTIDPGDTLGGFAIESPLPPGPTSIYLTGEVRIEPVSGEPEMERLWEQCETVRQSFLEAAKEVPTVGPVEGDFQPVGIDIHPGSDENPVNPKKKGVIPVAILGSSDFDLSQLDTATLTFGPGGAPVANRGHQRRDVDGDGITDRVVHFDARSAGIECHDTLAFVHGETVGGEDVQGFDTLTTPGCRGR